MAPPASCSGKDSLLDEYFDHLMGVGGRVVFYSVGMGGSVDNIDITHNFDKKLNKIQVQCNKAG